MAYSRGGFDDRDIWERRASSRGPPVREFEELDSRARDRVPAFMRDDVRRAEPGPMVLRQRDTETVEHHSRRSPSVTRVRAETKIVERRGSLTPPPRRELIGREDVRIRRVDRESVRSPSRVRIVEMERSPSPPSPPVHDRVRARFVERGRSPSPDRRDRIRVVERERQRQNARSVSSSSSPSPPPAPQVIKGPTIEREVITHWRDVDHGVTHAHTPTPPPPRVRAKGRDTEIDIWASRNETEVDIHKHSRSRGRSRSRSVERRPPRMPARVYDDEVLVRADRDHLHVDIDHHHRSMSRHRRAHSAAPPIMTHDDEAEYITSRINDRGRMGEAWHGHTKDWTIVDVPPGTERVRLDGAGGAAAEVTWSKYSGVRRAKFIPEVDGTLVTTSSTTSLSDTRGEVRDRERGGDRVNVIIYDSDREREVDVERVTDRRVSIRTPAPRGKKSELWTEITKDLVTREAIEQLGYQYEETEFFYYILQYLQYEDVLELVKLSEEIRRARKDRKDRKREIQWERELHIDWDREHRHRHHHRHSVGRYDD